MHIGARFVGKPQRVVYCTEGQAQNRVRYDSGTELQATQPGEAVAIEAVIDTTIGAEMNDPVDLHDRRQDRVVWKMAIKPRKIMIYMHVQDPFQALFCAADNDR